MAADPPTGEPFPRALDSYAETGGIWDTLKDRASEEPFNLVATLLFPVIIRFVQTPREPDTVIAMQVEVPCRTMDT